MGNPPSSKKGTLLVLLAAILWGTTGTTQGLAPEGVSSAVIGATRLLIGGLGLLLIHIINNGSHIHNSQIEIDRKRLFLFFILGVLTVIGYQLSFFYGVKLSGVAIGTVVAIGSSPFWAGLLGFIFLKEKPTKIWYISTICSILGLIFLVYKDGNSNSTINISGITLNLTAGFSYAMYALSAKVLLKKYKPDFIMTIFFLGGSILLLPVIFSNDMKWILTLKGSLLMIHLGFFATALSYFLFSRGLHLIHVSKASTLSLAEPLTASILGITILHENITSLNLLGIIIIFFSLLILSKN
ncbi:MAG: EamA family transporter [Deferribacterales bacterium]